MKIGDTLTWYYGFKLFSSLGDYLPDSSGYNRTKLILIDHSSHLSVLEIGLTAIALSILI